MPDDTPSLSLNQLALYLTSDARKRKRVIEQRKDPQVFRVNWYEFAQDKIVQFIAAGCEDEDILVAEVDRLLALSPKNDYEETRNNTNAEAIEDFLYVYQDLTIDPLSPKKGKDNAPKIEINGVEISVRPDILLSGNHRGEKRLGAIKLYFSKGNALGQTSGAYISTVLHEYLSRHHSKTASISRRYCQVLDVFGQAVYEAPASTKRRLSIIEDACEEVKLWWGVIG